MIEAKWADLPGEVRTRDGTIFEAGEGLEKPYDFIPDRPASEAIFPR